MLKFVNDLKKMHGVVTHACLQKEVFTIGALDNFDHNPSSTTVVDAFHGFGISLFQFPTKADPDEDRTPVIIPPCKPVNARSLIVIAWSQLYTALTTAVHVPVQLMSIRESELLSLPK